MFIKLTSYFCGSKGDVLDYYEFSIMLNKSCITAIIPEWDKWLKEETIVIYTTNGIFRVLETMSKIEELLK